VLYPDADSLQVYEWNKLRSKNTATKNSQKYFDGVEDPRIVSTENGAYLMTYTAYDGKTARLCMAISKDLLHWQKKGLVLKEPAYKNYWSKSGALVVKQAGSQMVAAKINNRYWMYFGDTDIFMASSTDLTNWQVATFSESKEMVPALQPRPGYFDSRLVEPGPFALLTRKGILLIYNASNAADYNDTLLSKFTYAAGQALFDTSKPYQLIKRQNNYFIHPDKDYEKVGEVNEVCFVEGLVYFKNKWFLYYGTADSKIAVAVKE
jgi:beta-1,2-mannosidase